ncbi:hypothetical protein V0U79_06940 [Hyphobacterium sp. HN65]|uniref:Uncharacterized protein n=1 Tax=Hyphobacterium lacteum TaxID=3116575 RepID=A0ABU7LQC2_9PROT|nr:hypothetical protein [Hyphobacterium sp. HN65]MEE2526097.1 hypothetical protein [Hyphobacterium sp. HN65]
MRLFVLALVLVLAACGLREPIYSDADHVEFQAIQERGRSRWGAPLNDLPAIEFWYSMASENRRQALAALSRNQDLSIQHAEEAARFILRLDRWRETCPLWNVSGWGNVCELSQRPDLLEAFDDIKSHPLGTELLKYAGQSVVSRTNRAPFEDLLSGWPFAVEVLADVAVYNADDNFLEDVFARPDMSVDTARWYLESRNPVFFPNAEWQLVSFLASQRGNDDLRASARLSLDLFAIQMLLEAGEERPAIDRYEGLPLEQQPLFTRFVPPHAHVRDHANARQLQIHAGIAAAYLDSGRSEDAQNAFSAAVQTIARRARLSFQDRESYEFHIRCFSAYYAEIFEEILDPTRTANQFFSEMTQNIPNLEACRRDDGIIRIRWPESLNTDLPALEDTHLAILRESGIILHVAPRQRICSAYFSQAGRRAASEFYSGRLNDLSAEFIDHDCARVPSSPTISDVLSVTPRAAAVFDLLDDQIIVDDREPPAQGIGHFGPAEVYLLYENPISQEWIAGIQDSSGYSLYWVGRNESVELTFELVFMMPYL